MSRRSLANTLFPYLCFVPIALLTGLVIFVPVCETVVNAFHDLDRYGNRIGFCGWSNFSATLGAPDFRASFWNTVVWTVAVVTFTLLVSLGAALALHQRFPGRRLARSILVLPWASSLVISAMAWKYIFDADFGPLNALLYQWGATGDPVTWLGRRVTSFPVMIGVAVFVSIPFTATVLLAGLQTIPAELYEAARVDGAGVVRGFWSVTLPGLRDVIAIAVIINVIYVFNSFPIVWTMTGGGPANTTDIVMTHLYKRAFTDKQFGPASAEAVITFAALAAFSAMYLFLQRRRDSD